MNYLLFDFFAFLVESSLLFVLAVLITGGLPFFQWLLLLLLLLLIDVIWALATWQITKSAVIPWAVVNTATIGIGLVVIYLPQADCGTVKPWALMVLAVARTIADYRMAWTFYFPLEEPVCSPTNSGTP